MTNLKEFQNEWLPKINAQLENDLSQVSSDDDLIVNIGNSSSETYTKTAQNHEQTVAHPKVIVSFEDMGSSPTDKISSPAVVALNQFNSLQDPRRVHSLFTSAANGDLTTVFASSYRKKKRPSRPLMTTEARA